LSAKVKSQLKTFAWDRWADAAKEVSLLVNATSAGMTGAQALDLPLDPLPVNASVCDLVYNPLETDLLRRAQAAGHRTIDGLGMLMYQAVPAFEAFYGEAPKVNPALRAELKKGLRGG
jgi:shikimate dehydrogenase